MNIIGVRQQQRIEKINTIKKSIKAVIDNGLELDEEKLIMQTCANWGLSRRTAKEYIAIARFNL